jgi:hypothetical protein
MGREQGHVSAFSYHAQWLLFNGYLEPYAVVMRRKAFWAAFGMSLVLLMGLAAGPASSTAPAAEPASQPTPRLTFVTATTAPANAMPREVLEAIDRRELGEQYDPKLADRYYEIHKLLEKYFETDSAEDRRALTKWIASFGVDANIIGRLVRIRMDWPALEAGPYHVNDRVGPHDVHYFLGVPKGYDRAKPWPLVIMLPSATPFVSATASKLKMDADSVAKVYTDWINDELRKHPDAVVVMPLLNLTYGWGPSYEGMNSVIQSTYHAASRVNVDPKRVYLVGHDMSGHAVWNLGLHYTTYFAAIMPLAGAASGDWQRIRLMNLRNTYVVAWHDADDPVIKVDASRQLVNVLKRFKYDVDYEETHNVGHTPPPQIVEQLYQKVRARSRDLYPREVRLQSNRPDTMFNRLDWLQMYQALRPGPDRRLLFRHGGGGMIVNQNGMTLEASVANNQIEARTDNLESMRFYLNDQMIDFAKPVTLRINKTVKFQGPLKPNLDEMLKDQLFLGRGWRYFTAVIDVDFGEPVTKPATRSATRTASPVSAN